MFRYEAKRWIPRNGKVKPSLRTNEEKAPVQRPGPTTTSGYKYTNNNVNCVSGQNVHPPAKDNIVSAPKHISPEPVNVVQQVCRFFRFGVDKLSEKFFCRFCILFGLTTYLIDGLFRGRGYI